MSVEKAIAKAWSDKEFKNRLINDTKSALAEVGVEVPDHMTVKVVENEPDTVNVVLPVAPPNAEELSLDELEGTAGAGFSQGMGCTPTCP